MIERQPQKTNTTKHLFRTQFSYLLSITDGVFPSFQYVQKSKSVLQGLKCEDPGRLILRRIKILEYFKEFPGLKRN